MSYSPAHLLTTLLAALVINASVAARCGATTDPAIETRKRLLENQRNVFRLRKELDELQIELQSAIHSYAYDEPSESLQEEIEELQDTVETANTIIENINDTISRQRLLLSTLERGSAPNTLDMALTKALNTNLSELTKNLEGKAEARQEIARLRSLLKQQAGLGERHIETPSSISYAAEQQLAADEFLRLLELISDGVDENVPDKPIKITGTEGSTPYTHLETMSYLGQAQYYLETTVHDGKMSFTVDGRPWHMTIPPSDNAATYVIIYDTSKDEQPRLVMFNKSLLTE